MQRALHPEILETTKLFLSALVACALAYPFLVPEPAGFAKELALLGAYGAVALGIIFSLWWRCMPTICAQS
jgi:hypothetical protein